MEAPLINDTTFSSTNPSLSEIWPHFPSPPPPPHPNSSINTRRKRNHSLSDTNECGTKHILKLQRLLAGSSVEDHQKPDTTYVLTNNSPEEQQQQNAKPCSETPPAPPPPPKQDYIHVRARRGQATDSHSLAERARREKISERMKILQDLVPGCNKVIGKAHVLDEIINYIQSLQSQVEFLSMKLEAVNSRLNMNPSIECFPTKDVGAHAFDLSGIIFGPQASRDYAQGSQSGWLHMQITGGFDKTT